jgi:hypothetical protein
MSTGVSRARVSVWVGLYVCWLGLLCRLAGGLSASGDKGDLLVMESRGRQAVCLKAETKGACW